MRSVGLSIAGMMGILCMSAPAQEQVAASVNVSSRDGATTVTSSDSGTVVTSGGVNIGTVSSRPTDVLARFFDLTEEQDEKARLLRNEYLAERQAAVDELETKLNASYLVRVLKILAPGEQVEFRKVMELVRACDEIVKAAEAEYRQSVADAGGDASAAVMAGTTRPEQIVYRTPGVTSVERERLRDVIRGIYTRRNQEVNDALSGTGVQRPGRGNREGWREYYMQRQKIRNEVYTAHSEETIDEIASGLSPAAAERFRALASAGVTLEQKRSVAREELTNALGQLIGPDRMKPATTGRDFMRRSRR